MLIPIKASNITGTDFCNSVMDIKGKVREEKILNEFLLGNVPDFLRDFKSVKITLNGNSITYLVMSDYLSVGNDKDYVRMPMNPLSAQKIATQYDCSLPTRKMVNDIWKASPNKLVPAPWGPPYDEDMLKTHRILTHNQRVQTKLAGKDFKELTSGHKKDVVLSNTLSPNNPKKRVCIYGWIQSNGTPIQGLNPFSHEDTYADYSHGIRFIANDVIVNGNPMRLQDVFSDGKLSALVSDEGVLTFKNY